VGEDNFSSLFDLLPIGAYRSTADGKQLRANAALVRLNGYQTEAEMLAAVNDISVEWYVQPDRRQTFRREMQLHGFVSGFVSEIFRHKTRERIWVREHAHAVKDRSGAILYYEGTVEDISSQRDAEAELRASERRFRALTEKAQVVTLLCDASGRIRYASQASLAILGRDCAELINTNIFDLVHPEDRRHDQSEFSSVVNRTNTGIENVSRFRHADGGWRHLASLGNNALDDEAVRGVVIHLRDVTEAHMAQLRMRELASVDVLTALPNRSAFEEASNRALAGARAAGQRVALYFIDLDHFKLVNDSLGHPAGDRLLRAIARRLRSALPANTVVARLGGDEFAMLDPCAGTASEIRTLASQIVQSLSAPLVVDDILFQISASIGVSIFPEHGDTFASLLKNADLAMFQAKSEQRDAYRVFDTPLARAAETRTALMADLRVAVDESQFEVFYQPQVRLHDGALIGIEALVRWRHPTRGLVEPAAFIPLAEELGLIGRIGLHVLKQALERASGWRSRFGLAFTLALNVSAFQLRDPTFIEHVRQQLARCNASPSWLELEITESALVQSIDSVQSALNAVRAMGVRVVIDDLGVAYSALSYLKRFQVDGIKLDRGFVAGVPDNAVDSAITRSIIALASSLNLRLVAEGVESEAQREYLLQQGCREAQGYLFSHPLGAADMTALLETAGYGLGQPVQLPLSAAWQP
jgi:diguanylate cyclase (GGDEF)-like protein/PAS domain S-box-containing protein